DNPCWPKAIASNDPGYNLLTGDNWYKTADSPQQQAAREKQKKLYSEEPPRSYLDNSKKPGRKVRRADDLEIETVEILDDGFGVRNANVSRRLTVDENVEIFRCTTDDCVHERGMLLEDEIAAIIPGQPESLSAQNANTASTALPQSMLMVVTADKRSEVSPDLPLAAGSGGYQL
ncbi:hypothetical protein K469DRAFT_805767, partial [Zopfia rhizophila CBS 207.26]